VKAYAVVAQEMPALRRAYCGWLRPHLVEYAHSVAAVAIERDWQGEKVVLSVRIKDPARLPLARIVERIRQAQTLPLEQIKDFRRIMWLSGLPRPLRRCLWRVSLQCARLRANTCGTFGLSVYSALGAESLHPLSPLTVTLNYGVIDPRGQVSVRMIYDHRVMDGATVARALVRLEQVLNTTICAELLAGPSQVTPSSLAPAA
jgi:hypothetical protein